MKIISVGECTLDRYLQQNQVRIGGISLNFAIHAKRSGAESVAFISRVGKADEAMIRAKLADEGLDDSHIYATDGPTAHQDIILTATGERIFPPGGYDFGCMAGFALNAADITHIQQYDVLACALFRQTQPLFEQVMQLPFAGWRVADFLDLSDFGGDVGVLARHLARLNIAFVSGHEAQLASFTALSTAHPHNAIVVTMGEHGSVAIVNGRMYRQPALPVPVTDTTGCGDAFQAAFTVAYYHSHDAALALLRGAEQAAKVAQQLGAS
ncbi:MAG: PfkB family carbohydrate kinase [Anaerolineae bacterium]|nr:PfkB family carbohydrate kinase [Anaerolineae bacterium]